jgi:transcriptional regulator with XRE-family HTH domain
MEKLELRIDKVKQEMERQGLTEKALAIKIGTSQQLVNYWLTSGSVVGVKRLAIALGYDAKDLIK